MRRTRRRIALVPAVLMAAGVLMAVGALAACDEEFDPPTLITELRVIGLAAEPADLVPGEVTTLEVLVAGLVYTAVAVAVTWPVLTNLGDVVLGGGELGGWLWREWWHFREIEALGQSELGAIERPNLLVALGRYPETGNVLDILLLSYPLDHWFGFPEHHNLKVLVVLAGNGLCGYALARSLTSAAE